MRAIPFFICAFSIATADCEQPAGFTPAEDPMGFDVSVLDTFHIQSSTLLADSLITSGLSRLLVGSQKHNDLGSLKISSYFKFAPGEFLGFEGVNMVYDSPPLILNYDGILGGGWAYDPEEDEWQEVTGFEGRARTAATAFTINNVGYVVTGRNGNSRFDDVWLFDPLEAYEEND